MIEVEIIDQLAEIKKLTLLGVKSVLTTDDVCLLTGFSKSHIYKLCYSNKIPHYKSAGGKANFFDKTEIENWMKSRRVSTDEELEEAAIKHCVRNQKGGARC